MYSYKSTIIACAVKNSLKTTDADTVYSTPDTVFVRIFDESAEDVPDMARPGEGIRPGKTVEAGAKKARRGGLAVGAPSSEVAGAETATPRRINCRPDSRFSLMSRQPISIPEPCPLR